MPSKSSEMNKPPVSAWSSSSGDGSSSNSMPPSPDAARMQAATQQQQQAHSDEPEDVDSTDDELYESELSMPWWRRIQQSATGPPEAHQLVISGLSGRFPESSTVAEFAEHLFNGDDMVTENDRRWPPGFYDLPPRHGKLKEVNKFDAQFFGVSPKQADHMDPQLRILLEVVHEAILDAGVNPAQVRGTKTGVFVGCSGSETMGILTRDPETVSGYTASGCFSSMFANRISYSFDFRGPSFPVDTACSSSLLALQLAVDALRQGHCEAAIVAGTSLTLTPNNALQFLRLGMLSEDGKSKSFDADGKGYVRSEGVVAIYLQRAHVARRLYATVINAKSNTDGYKQAGITVPSGIQQAVLLEELYREAGVNPKRVSYVEAHGTGTPVGDPQEAHAITQVFCRNRKTPLLIGSVKSNMGHAEPASGLCSIAKLLISMERDMLPPNLHYNEPNPYIAGLTDGRLQVVDKPMRWPGGYVGINSFGFGGANTHVLLKSHQPQHKRQDEDEVDGFFLPEAAKLLCVAGRTEEGVRVLLESANQHLANHNYYCLLAEQSNLNPAQSPFRGYAVMNRDQDLNPTIDIQKVPLASLMPEVDASAVNPRPVWFIYSGMGSQWAGMAQQLMRIDLFKQSVMRCSEAVRSFGVDPYSLIMGASDSTFDNTMHCMTCITAIQIALTDLLRTIGIEPDGIIGHSTGEMACGYADGCLTRAQTMVCAYYRGQCIMQGGIRGTGAMAAVGLSWEEAVRRSPPGVIAACHNGKQSVTVSGDADKVQMFIEELQKEEVFAKLVKTSGVPFHSPTMQKVRQPMLDGLLTVIGDPRQRSNRWVSSSVPEAEWNTPLAQACSADYQVNNAMKPVLFYEALQKIQDNAVTIEIGPHALLQSVLRTSTPASCSHVGLLKAKATNEMELLLSNIGKVYQAGIPTRVQNLYGTVKYPVPKGTPMISPLVRWDHSQNWQTISGHETAALGSGGTAASVKFTIDPNAADSKDKYLLDHVIDGRTLYPFTGFVCLAWRAVCKLRGVEWSKTPVLLRNVTVHRATILNKQIRFDVVVTPGDGRWEVLENEQLTASGVIEVVDEQMPNASLETAYPAKTFSADDSTVRLLPPDVYKELSLRGYEYKKEFQDVREVYEGQGWADVTWKDNWVTFLDTLLQTSVFMNKEDGLKLPTTIRYLHIDPNEHAKYVKTNEEDGTQFVRIFNDSETNECWTGGVQMCELTALSAPRRVLHGGNYFMETIEFIEHQDLHCLADLVDVRGELQAYRQALAETLVEQWPAIAGVVGNCTQAPMLRAAMNKLDKATTGRTVGAGSKQGAWLQLIRDMADQDDFDSFVALIASRADQLAEDRLYGCALMQRAFKPMLDISAETSPGHLLKYMALEPQDTHAIKMVSHYTDTHPLMHCEWTLLGEGLDDMLNECQTKWPTQLVKMDFFASTSVPASAAGCCGTLIADKSLHWATDIPRALQRLKEFIRDDGFAIIVENTSDYELSFATDAFRCKQLPAFGDGNRIYGLYLSHADWLREFDAAGLVLVGCQSDEAFGSTVYLLHKQPPTAKQPVQINIDDVDEFSWVEPLKTVIEERLGQDDTNTVWLVNDKLTDNGTVGLGLCLREEGGSKANRIRTIVNASTSSDQSATIEPAAIDAIIKHDLHSNCYRNGKWGSFRHLTVAEDKQQSYTHKEHAYINTAVRGDLSSLRFYESSNQYFDRSTAADYVEMCYVYFAPLNFRDIMVASGRLSVDAIPPVVGGPIDSDCLLGTEFAGRIEGTGTRVMGLLPGRALATTVLVDKRYSFAIPDAWTMEEASTVPVAYCTAYYALVVRGQMQRGDSVLIHSGSGGVGQAAIAVALSYGCRVFTTVGTPEKRKFLLDRFPELNTTNIFNSRSTQFEREIRWATRGKGVDIVLNSLSETKLQASLRCLATHGRFCEIGKYDLNKNSALGMKLFLKNVTFHGILLDALTDGKNHEWLAVNKLLCEGIAKGVVRPLPNTNFPASRVEEAFRFMASGKHIGKVVVQMRPEEAGIVEPQPISVRAVSRTCCPSNTSYLITGGLGGFGLELAQWLASRGAKHLVLTSRTGVRTGYQARCVNALQQRGVNVVISTRDIAERQETAALIDDCNALAPLAGVFHLAMVLKDSLFENQTADNFKAAAKMKYLGTRHLDVCTRKMCGDELKWFVMFSSITSGRGNAGQTNYGWANCTMERVVEQRRAAGHCAQAIQWGAIGDVGVIIDSLGDNSTVVGGTLPQRMQSCLNALDTFLCWDAPIVSSYVRADVGTKKATGDTDVINAIARIMGLNDASSLNLDANLGDLGIDSLMGVEIRTVLEKEYDIVLSMKDVRTLSLRNLKALTEGDATVIQKVSLQRLSDVAAGKDKLSSDDTTSVQALNSEQLEQQMNKLFKLRIDVNDLLSFNDLVRVNDVAAGTPVFFVHSIEGIGAPVKKLCAQLNMPVYCLQCTPNTPLDSIEHAAQHYIKLMETQYPSGPYRIVGYSYGACIAFEMACQLERAERACRTVLLDGSHLYMQTYRKAYRLAYGVQTNDLTTSPLFETEILLGFAMRFANFDYGVMKKNLLNLDKWEQRVDTVTQAVMLTGLFNSEHTFVWGCNSLRQKFFAADKYNPTDKLHSDIVLLRAEQGAAKEIDVGHDYGLKQACSGTVEVHVIDGDHDSFVQGSNSHQTAAILNTIFAV